LSIRSISFDVYFHLKSSLTHILSLLKEREHSELQRRQEQKDRDKMQLQIHPKKQIIVRFNEQQELEGNVDFANRIFVYWLSRFDKRYSTYYHKDVFKRILNTCTQHLAHLLALFSCKRMYLHVIYYCDMYIHRKRNVSVVNLLQLLAVSSMLALKFWEFEHFEEIGSIVSNTSLLPMHKLHRLEREMLQTINYELFVDEERLQTFKERMNRCLESSSPAGVHAYVLMPTRKRKMIETCRDGGRLTKQIKHATAAEMYE